MERLTKKEMIEGHEMKYVSADDCFDMWVVPQKFMGEAIDRLAAYEDIGFTPEEMKDIIDMFHSYRHICAGLEPQQVEELVKAEKDGRPAVLPNEKDMLNCCPMRVKQNGNCSPMGGFCKPDTEICKALHAAYEAGAFNAPAKTASTVALPSNEPLTVYELREMDGEPVWWEDKYGRSGWGLVSGGPECVVIVCTHDQDFVAAVRGKMNTPFVVGIYCRKPDVKENVD